MVGDGVAFEGAAVGVDGHEAVARRREHVDEVFAPGDSTGTALIIARAAGIRGVGATDGRGDVGPRLTLLGNGRGARQDIREQGDENSDKPHTGSPQGGTP